MKFSVRLRRRNKRAKAVRRLQGVVNAQDVTLKALRAQVQGLGGRLLVRDEELDCVTGAAGRAGMALWGAVLAARAGRIRTLERVPRLLRRLFGAL